MGLWDDFTSGVSGFFDSAGQAAGSDYGSQFLSGVGSDIFGGGYSPYSGPLVNPQVPTIGATGAGYGYTPVMAAAPAVLRGGAMVGRSFFNKFPNLAVAIQGFKNAGMNVSRSKLYSLLKRFGPDFLIAGGILSAGAISELMMAGPGRRRMNPGNVKALRRAHRRMKSFHHVCQTNDTLLTHRRRVTRRGSFGGTSITQVK
jgi:hypothetical protein